MAPPDGDHAEAVPDGRHWFEDLADHLSTAYLRYSFTKGTVQEVDALVDLLHLEPGQRVLDVGCGPGRHANELARRGFEVVGADISQRFVDLAAAAAEPGATFVRLDARRLEFEAEFDAVISLCQGAFGLSGGPGAPGPVPAGPELEEPVLAGMARALRPGGSLALSAFSAYFQLRHLEPGDRFDPEDGVNHEHTTIRGPDGVEVPAELWTTCFTPRELRLLARCVGLEPVAVHGATPGGYGHHPVTLDRPELLLVARRAGPAQRPPAPAWHPGTTR
jgi:SAM-dependent methyltransferase